MNNEPVRRIRIACIIDSIGPSAGTENQLVEILERIDSSRFELHLCCLESSDRFVRLSKRFHVALLPTDSVYSMNGIRQCVRLSRYLQHHDIDIVHTYMVRSNVLGVFAARWAGRRTVVASRRNSLYWYSGPIKWLFRYLNSRTTRLMANSERVREVVARTELVALSRIDVVNNGVEVRNHTATTALVRPAALPEGSFLVGIVANLRPVKDLPLFLRAARVVADHVPQARFVIFGRGPMREELGKLAATLGIAGKVVFTDGHASIPDSLPHLSVGCLSSVSEGFSNAVLEYMAAGLPVVATDAGGNSEAVNEGVTGFIVRDRTPEAFAEPIIRLLTNEERRKKMGAASRARCLELYEMNRTVRKLETYYSSLPRRASVAA